MSTGDQKGVFAGTTRFLSFGRGHPPNPVRHSWHQVGGPGYSIRLFEIYLASTRRSAGSNSHAWPQTVTLGQTAVERGPIVARGRPAGPLQPSEGKGLTIAARLGLFICTSDRCSCSQIGRRDREGRCQSAVGCGHLRTSSVRMRSQRFGQRSAWANVFFGIRPASQAQ